MCNSLLIVNPSMEVEQSIMGIKPSQLETQAKLLCSNVLHLSLIILVNGLHHQLNQHGALTPQLLKVDVCPIGGQTTIHVGEKVYHLNTEHLRFICILHIKTIERSIIAEYREITFSFKIPHSCFHPQYILSTSPLICFPSYQGITAQVHITDRCRKYQVHRLLKAHFQSIRHHHAPSRDSTAHPLIKVSRGGHIALSIILCHSTQAHTKSQYPH
ncbi:hypothetical protein IX299_002057 [Porphyromonas levii]|nr:hypothetical protein [Porphyromonas levii]